MYHDLSSAAFRVLKSSFTTMTWWIRERGWTLKGQQISLAGASVGTHTLLRRGRRISLLYTSCTEDCRKHQKTWEFNFQIRKWNTLCIYNILRSEAWWFGSCVPTENQKCQLGWHPGDPSSGAQSEALLSLYFWQVGGALPSQAFKSCEVGDPSVKCCIFSQGVACLSWVCKLQHWRLIPLSAAAPLSFAQCRQLLDWRLLFADQPTSSPSIFPCALGPEVSAGPSEVPLVLLAQHPGCTLTQGHRNRIDNSPECYGCNIQCVMCLLHIPATSEDSRKNLRKWNLFSTITSYFHPSSTCWQACFLLLLLAFFLKYIRHRTNTKNCFCRSDWECGNVYSPLKLTKNIGKAFLLYFWINMEHVLTWLLKTKIPYPGSAQGSPYFTGMGISRGTAEANLLPMIGFEDLVWEDMDKILLVTHP